MTDYGTKVFKKGKHEGSTYQQVLDKEGAGYFDGMIKQENGDPEYLVIWKENMRKWLDIKSSGSTQAPVPEVQVETVQTVTEEANKGLSGLAKDIIDVRMDLGTVIRRVESLEIKSEKWTE